MEAKVQHKEDVVVVNLKGFIDIETAKPFREACMKSIARLDKRIIFNLEGLNFVGSNGIIPFLQTLEELRSQSKMQMGFCKVSSEFQKIFSASPLNDIEIYEDEDGTSAVNSNQEIA